MSAQCRRNCCQMPARHLTNFVGTVVGVGLPDRCQRVVVEPSEATFRTCTAVVSRAPGMTPAALERGRPARARSLVVVEAITERVLRSEAYRFPVLRGATVFPLMTDADCAPCVA